MLRSWLSQSHSGAREIAGLAALYGLYEVVRGAGGENVQAALANTADIVAVEQAIGIYVERGVQESFEAIPFAPTLLGLAYVLLHFVGTAVALVWVHRKHPDRFPIVRTTFVAATALALVGYVFFPAAPPRLSELGFSDTVTSSTGLDLSSDLLGALYNPFAAVPSLHFGYALIVGVVLAVVAQRRIWRIAGALYPATMLLIIVATGNHFFVDAALGGLVVVIGWLVARSRRRHARPASGRVARRDVRLRGLTAPAARRIRWPGAAVRANGPARIGAGIGAPASAGAPLSLGGAELRLGAEPVLRLAAGLAALPEQVGVLCDRLARRLGNELRPARPGVVAVFAAAFVVRLGGRRFFFLPAESFVSAFLRPRPGRVFSSAMEASLVRRGLRGSVVARRLVPPGKLKVRTDATSTMRARRSSSAGQSTCLVNRGSTVRIRPPAPDLAETSA